MSNDRQLFLVIAKIDVLYMDNNRHTSQDMRIVWATDAAEAQAKYERAMRWEPSIKSYSLLELIVRPALV